MTTESDKESAGFPVLGDQPFSDENLQIAKAELRHVIPQVEFSLECKTRRIVRPGSITEQWARAGILLPACYNSDDYVEATRWSVDSMVFGWAFRREWCYWNCYTIHNPIPINLAKKLNEKWMKEVRVNGYSGGTVVINNIHSYHVDTPRGLAVLVEAIDKLR